MIKTKNSLFSMFIKIRSNKGDSLASSQLLDMKISELDYQLQQASCLYQTQLNRASNTSSLYKLKSNETKNVTLTSYNQIFTHIVKTIENDFETYQGLIESKLERITNILNKEEGNVIHILTSLNLVHNINTISYHLNEIRPINQLYVIELLLLKSILKKIEQHQILFSSEIFDKNISN